MKEDVIRRYERRRCLKDDPPHFRVGDVVVVHYRIKEGEKERVQPFEGRVIRFCGGGAGTTFTVRKIVAGEGVERTFPLHSPNLVDVKVSRRGVVRRARLYYLRKRVGKATRLKEKVLTTAEYEAEAEKIRRRRASKQQAEEERLAKSTEEETEEEAVPGEPTVQEKS